MEVAVSGAVAAARFWRLQQREGAGVLTSENHPVGRRGGSGGSYAAGEAAERGNVFQQRWGRGSSSGSSGSRQTHVLFEAGSWFGGWF